MPWQGWLFIGIGIFVIVLFAVIIYWSRRFGARRAHEVVSQFKGKTIHGVTSSANFFGQQSKGAAQARGNGVLVLVDDELYFQMWAPKRELRIPFTALRGVEQVKSFLGKTKFVPLLKVDFENDQGEADAAAWLVKDLPQWKSGLEKIIQGQG